MDAREGLGDDRLDTQLQRRKGSVLPARALSVVGAAHHEATSPLLRPGRELGVLVLKGELRNRGDIGPVRHNPGPIRGHVAGRDVIAPHDQDPSLEAGRHRLVFGRRFDVWSADDLDLPGLFRRRWRQDVPVVDFRVVGSDGEGWFWPEGSGIGEHPGESGRRCGSGGDEVDIVILGPAASREISIEGPDRNRAAGRSLAHAHARTAGGLQHPGAGSQQVTIDTRGGDGVQNLA